MKYAKFCWNAMASYVLWIIISITLSAWAQEEKLNYAVISFKSDEGVTTDEADIIADRLCIELFNTGLVNMMERDQMNEILEEQGFQQSGACTDDACMVEAGQLLGVERLVSGSIGILGKMFVLNFRSIDVKTGRIISVVSRDISEEIEVVIKHLPEIANRLVGKSVKKTPISEKTGDQGIFQFSAAAGYNIMQIVKDDNENSIKTGPGFTIAMEGVFHPLFRDGGIAANIGLGAGVDYTFPIVSDDRNLGWVAHPDFKEGHKGSIQWIAIYLTPQLMIPLNDNFGLRLLTSFGGAFFLPDSSVQYPPYHHWDEDVDGGFYMKIGAGMQFKFIILDIVWKRYYGDMYTKYYQTQESPLYSEDVVRMKVISISAGIALRRR